MAPERSAWLLCPRCGRIRGDIKVRHMSTAYPNEESNYCCVCLRCFDRIEQHWTEMNQEYMDAVMGSGI